MLEVTKFDLERTYGVEIEAYGRNRHDVAAALMVAGIQARVESYNHDDNVRDARGNLVPKTWWRLVTDGSVTGTDAFELVSPALKGEDGLRQIRTACEVLQRLGVKVNKSCGFHVHHAAQDYDNVTYFKNVVKLYARMEAWLDQAMAPSRRGNTNQFCKSVCAKMTMPAGRGLTGQQALDQCQRPEDVNNWMRLGDLYDPRYNKVNLSSWWRHGTIEFRQHAGTIDAEKIVNWVVLTQLILRKARTTRTLTYQDANERAARHAKGWGCMKPANELGLMSIWPQCDAYVQGTIEWIEARRKEFIKKEQLGEQVAA